MPKIPIHPAVTNRLVELEFTPLPPRTLKKINEVFTSALREAEAELAKKLLTEKSLPRLVAEAMSQAAREAETPPLPGFDNQGGGVE